MQILDFFQESFLERGLHVSMNGKFIFSGKFIFRWRGHLIGVDSALMAEGGWGGKKLMEWEAPYSCLSPLGETLVCVVTGLKRSMNYNMLWKIYKKRILTLQEKALLHRWIFKTFLRSVQHIYLMIDFKPLLDLRRH